MLGIIGAMDEEVLKIKEHMEQVTVETYAGMEFHRGMWASVLPYRKLVLRPALPE